MTGFPNLPCLKKKEGYGYEGAGKRERPAERVWEGLGYGFEWLLEGLNCKWMQRFYLLCLLIISDHC